MRDRDIFIQRTFIIFGLFAQTASKGPHCEKTNAVSSNLLLAATHLCLIHPHCKHKTMHASRTLKITTLKKEKNKTAPHTPNMCSNNDLLPSMCIALLFRVWAGTRTLIKIFSILVFSYLSHGWWFYFCEHGHQIMYVTFLDKEC